jgi:hypothetical protein
MASSGSFEERQEVLAIRGLWKDRHPVMTPVHHVHAQAGNVQTKMFAHRFNLG